MCACVNVSMLVCMYVCVFVFVCQSEDLDWNGNKLNQIN